MQVSCEDRECCNPCGRLRRASVPLQGGELMDMQTLIQNRPVDDSMKVLQRVSSVE